MAIHVAKGPRTCSPQPAAVSQLHFTITEEGGESL